MARQQQHRTPGHSAQVLVHTVSVASSSSLDRLGCLTHHWMFFPHTAPNSVLSCSEYMCASTLGVMKEKQSIIECLFSFWSSHLFFCILLACQHVLEGAAGEGKEWEEGGRDFPCRLESIIAESAAWCPNWVQPIRAWDRASGLRVKPQNAVIQDSFTAERRAFLWDSENTLERDERKPYKVKGRINGRYGHKSWNVCFTGMF